MSPASTRAFEHGGATGTRLHVDPDPGLVLVYLTGLWGHPGWTSDAVLHAVYAAMG